MHVALDPTGMPLSRSSRVLACALALAPTMARPAHALVGGAASSGAEQESVVAIAVVADGLASLDCSGTLIAADLVLTARSCIATMNEGGAFQDASPSSFSIYAGARANTDIASGASPAAVVQRFFVPATSAIHPDVAVLQLDRRLGGAIATLRLGAPPKAAEGVTVTGFGMDEQNRLPTRRQRGGLSVSSLAAGQFATTGVMCTGDYGGPAFAAKTKAVVGVATAVGSNSDTNGPCIGGGSKVVFTDLAAAKDTIDRAFEAAGGSPKLEAGSTKGGGAGGGDDDEDRGSAKKSKKDREGDGDEEVVSEDAVPEELAIASTGCAASRRREAGDGAPLLLLTAALLIAAARSGRGRADARAAPARWYGAQLPVHAAPTPRASGCRRRCRTPPGDPERRRTAGAGTAE